MKKLKRWMFAAGGAVALQLGAAGQCAESAVSLEGQWRFQLDRSDVGITEKWFERTLLDRIKLPGSLPAQGIGDEVTVDTKWIGGIVDKSWFTAPEYEKYRQPGNVKIPFWLQPEKYYAGAVWYQRDIEIPAEWAGLTAVLLLERPHWETRVWLDDKLIGTNNALATPHNYELGPLVSGKHRLTIRVDNRMIVDVGENSHSVSDHTQGDWNGIVGRIELRAKPRLWISQQRIVPKNDGTVRVEVGIRNTLFDSVIGTLTAIVREKGAHSAAGQASVKIEYARGLTTEHRHIFTTHATQEIVVKLDRPPKLWSEFTPDMYEVETRIEAQGGRQTDVAVETFGFREFMAQDTQFAINGRKTVMRGTLDCCIFPKTGHPPTDVAEWKRIIGVAKAHGLNLIRFHSWCPPEAAFVAADEMGFYFHVECSSWPNQSAALGEGKPVDRWLYDEADRILRYYGNHPSLVLMLHGNEPGGKNRNAYLAKWVEHFKAKDPRRLWSSGAGWPELPENQWHCVPQPRIQAWGGGLKSRINAKPPETRTDYTEFICKRTVPVVSHEIGQWCVYPNFDEIKKYTGYLKPKNFEIFRDKLKERGMSDLARKFLLASGKLQTLCYKEEIESALRTPGMGGFELLDLHDFPGQGTALVGVLDPFWESKGYVTPQEYSRFCNATVPLARMSKRVFMTDEKLEADIEVAHFGPAPMKDAVASWRLVGDDGRVVASGKLPAKTLPVDNGIALGGVSVELKNVSAPARYKLVVGLDGSKFENDWDVWVYLPKVDTQPPQDVRIADDLNAAALAALDAGGKVLLMIPPKRVKNAAKDKVVLGFSSIFWNTAWTRRQPPTTLGILCDPKHPALADFPTDYHSNWQWWYLVTRAGAMILDDLPRGLRPVVQVIDDWFTARKLGLVFEAKLGKGKLLVCSVDLKNELEQNPVARQMRHSLLRYMGSDRFNPEVAVTREAVARLMTSGPGSELARLDAKIWVDSEDDAHDNVKANALDGDPQTFWHTQWQPTAKPMPHWLVVDLGGEMALAGITYLPRQDMANGRIAEAEVYCSNEPKKWSSPVAIAKWGDTSDRQTIRFAKPVTARYLKLVPKSEVRGQPFAAVAELDIIRP
ncbi:MAG: discoidin domain-containing protein [Verrucomicrobia bacterium]|nr:discoidin domain-containing protein [Verrucomicrobiota bacterium]